MPAIIGAIGRFALKKLGTKGLKNVLKQKSFKMPGGKKVPVHKGYRSKGKKGETVNKGNKWSRWGEKL